MLCRGLSTSHLAASRSDPHAGALVMQWCEACRKMVDVPKRCRQARPSSESTCEKATEVVCIPAKTVTKGSYTTEGSVTTGDLAVMLLRAVTCTGRQPLAYPCPCHHCRLACRERYKPSPFPSLRNFCSGPVDANRCQSVRCQRCPPVPISTTSTQLRA